MTVRRSRFPGLAALSERRQQLVDNLAAARRERGLSQAEVAARMGTSQAAVARLEAGQVDLRLSTMERYAAAVGVRLEVRLDVRPAPDTLTPQREVTPRDHA